MKPVDDIAGVILSGGRSARMGADKALLTYKGRRFIEIIAGEMKTVFSEVVIISDGPGKYGFTGLPVYEDMRKNSGPLAGIFTALSIMKKDIFVVSSDLPLINSRLIRSLVNKSGNEDVTLFSSGGQLQPLFSLIRYRCMKKIESDLEGGKLSVYRFIQQSASAVHESENFEGEDLSPYLLNLNTPEEYRALLRRERII